MESPNGPEILEALDEARRRGAEGLGRKALALERLLAVSEQISTLDLDAALRRILQCVLELTGTRRGALMLVGDGVLRVELAVNLDLEELAGEAFAFSRSVAERALETGEVIVVEDAPASRHRDQPSILSLGLTALLAIPLKARERQLGVIYLDTDSPAHTVHVLERSILAAFGSQAAVALENARLYRHLQDDYFELRRAVEKTLSFDGILYRSPAMHRVREAVRQVAASGVTVLIQGETGTGKELVARALHLNGPRRDRRFLSQNAGALPDELLESELFGHRRGAFSGAVENKPGLFEAADGGTVFLDEIGEASPALQVRLLRFLETGSFRRIGETADRQADVRVLAATHRDLEEEVRAGRFRADLYYRLSVFPIRVPPLRERREDIEPLVHHFVERFNREQGRGVRRVPRETLRRLVERDWPGNVRELQNVIQRLVLLSPGEDLEEPEALETIPAETSAAPAADSSLLRTLEEVERDHILRVLRHVDGNQSAAARVLGLKRGTLRWRLKKLGVDS